MIPNFFENGTVYLSYGELEALIFLAELRPSLKIPRLLAFAPAKLSPPYDDLDKLYFIDANQFEFITGIGSEFVTDYQVCGFKEQRFNFYKDKETFPVVAFYDNGNFLGATAGFAIDDEVSLKIIHSLAAFTPESVVAAPC